ncbi:ABC transporter substrate-binding protein [Colwellia sp. 1_MG-2023]|uniref:ABC transporter substrate-binding protein n=1 Tax=Colwellia sp. 1_MG-2023 TaxID=3062649 RepID=UPI0026E18385|nr:ABC transporter substrate-binding protein [Colwellia sp. 1_MG-2023]MDO6446990.1 ABC transporter substrate-binding protein [Colwellia sp. 1_MG-2023]
MKYVYFLVLILCQTYACAIEVTFINPSVPGTPFWDRVTAIAKAAAEDLDINLTVVYGKDNRVFNLEAIQTVASKSTKPDYLIFMPYDGNSAQSFLTLEQAKIHFLTLERTLLPEEQKLIELPQEKYRYWLGEIFHDNTAAGELLADTLIASASKDTNGVVRVAGLAGSFSGESTQRTLGLENSINKHENIQLLQVAPAIWSRERSRYIIHQMAARFGNIDIAWAASDGMALGVLDSVKSGFEDLNPNMKIGGIDWTVEAIEKVKSKELVATVGGHIFQAAWGLIKIYDHHHGKSVFIKGIDQKTYDLQVIDQSNINTFYLLAEKVNWHKVDFNLFTLTTTKNNQYNFDIALIMAILN